MKSPFAHLILFLLLSGGAVSAQSPETLHQVRLRDGTTIVGRIESQDSLRVVLVSLTDARYELQRSNIS